VLLGPVSSVCLERRDGVQIGRYFSAMRCPSPKFYPALKGRVLSSFDPHRFTVGPSNRIQQLTQNSNLACKHTGFPSSYGPTVDLRSSFVAVMQATEPRDGENATATN
jgi:hypothetical protein